MGNPRDGWDAQVSWHQSLYTRSLTILLVGAAVLIVGIVILFQRIVDEVTLEILVQAGSHLLQLAQARRSPRLFAR